MEVDMGDKDTYQGFFLTLIDLITNDWVLGLDY
jgi:hypothetical protein